jgi:hypothetical protein
MGYMSIDNLYKNQQVLMFKEVYVMEKIHGTSAHIKYERQYLPLTYFPGGVKLELFKEIFNDDSLLENFTKIYTEYPITVYGEAYGGSCQKMSETYGKELRFIVFDVKIGERFLNVEDAEEIAKSLGLEFVWYTKCSTDIEVLNQMRDRDSEQAIRNGIGTGKKMEGIVIRPIVELSQNNGKRIICKHKRDDFSETKTPRIVDSEKLKVLSDANAVAEEWVTHMRMDHILDKITKPHGYETIPQVITAMIEDITREGEGEIEWSKDVNKAISNRTVAMYKARLSEEFNKNI